MKLTLVLSVCLLFTAITLADDEKDELVKKYAELITKEQEKAQQYKIRTNSRSFEPTSQTLTRKYYFLCKQKPFL